MIFTDEEIKCMRKIVESILANSELMWHSTKNHDFKVDTFEVVEYVKEWIIDYKKENNIDVMIENDFVRISKDCINDFNVKVAMDSKEGAK